MWYWKEYWDTTQRRNSKESGMIMIMTMPISKQICLKTARVDLRATIWHANGLRVCLWFGFTSNSNSFDGLGRRSAERPLNLLQCTHEYLTALEILSYRHRGCRHQNSGCKKVIDSLAGYQPRTKPTYWRPWLWMWGEWIAFCLNEWVIVASLLIVTWSGWWRWKNTRKEGVVLW